VGEQGTAEEDTQAPGEAAVQAGGEAARAVLPKERQMVKIHGALRAGVGVV
jgi:hypothetical protein